jgi:hypothetical protein
VLNELQRYAATGCIDTGILATFTDKNLDTLVDALRNKEFSAVRKWVAQNVDGDVTPLFRKIYDNMSDNIQPQSIPQTVVTLADYQYKSAFVADQEINFMAFLTELMVEVEWK